MFHCWFSQAPLVANRASRRLKAGFVGGYVARGTRSVQTVLR